MLTILFDLDGTLLPMDYDTFEKAYFTWLVSKMLPFGMNPDEIVSSVWGGIHAMLKSDGTKTNEETFWDESNPLYAGRLDEMKAAITDAYENDFGSVLQCCGDNGLIPAGIENLKARGCRLVVATSPMFPMEAIRQRIYRAHLNPADFAYITSYENSHHIKPDLNYYRELLSVLRLEPEDALMIGNDMTEDLAAQELGIKTFIVTDCLINRENRPLTSCPHGDWNDAFGWIEQALGS